jgi:hypothetical protein
MLRSYWNSWAQGTGHFGKYPCDLTIFHRRWGLYPVPRPRFACGAKLSCWRLLSNMGQMVVVLSGRSSWQRHSWDAYRRNSTYRWMDRWMYGWMDRWIDGWIETWIETWIDRRLGKPFGDAAVESLCHLWFTTAKLSYRFTVFETSATALCGTTGMEQTMTVILEEATVYVPDSSWFDILTAKQCRRH